MERKNEKLQYPDLDSGMPYSELTEAEVCDLHSRMLRTMIGMIEDEIRYRIKMNDLFKEPISPEIMRRILEKLKIISEMV